MTRNKNNLPLLHVKHNFYKNYFFPSAIIEWNHVDSNIRNSETNYTRLRLGLSHLQFHKFKHNFQVPLNPTCSCGAVETAIHYLLHCPNFSNEQSVL